jgi:sporulation protein YlmC with PRC-barrel domain
MNYQTTNTESSNFNQFPSRVLSASSLSSDDVYNRNSDKLGSIKELMIDIEKGTICYAVLSFGGILTLGEKLFAIPWSAFTVDLENKRLLLNIEEETLKNAPGFDADNWPNMADATWGESINSYYTI